MDRFDYEERGENMQYTYIYYLLFMVHKFNGEGWKSGTDSDYFRLAEYLISI